MLRIHKLVLASCENVFIRGNGFLINCVHLVCFCYICNLTSCEIHISWHLDIFSRCSLYYSSFLWCIVYFMTFIIELFFCWLFDFTSNLPAAKIYAFFCLFFSSNFFTLWYKGKKIWFFSVMHHRGMKLLCSLQYSELNGMNMCVCTCKPYISCPQCLP